MNLLGVATLRHSVWDSYAEECSRKIPHDNPTAHRDELARRSQDGDVKVLKILKGDTPAGLVVYEIEEKAAREFVIVAMYSEDGKNEIASEILSHLERYAAFSGCSSIRFHTCRPGLIVKGHAHGFRTAEVILRKNVQQ